MNEAAITARELERVLGATFSATLCEQCRKADLRYTELTPEERDGYVIEVVEALAGAEPPAAGEGRCPDWETGWGQNLEAFRKSRDAADLVPRYHGKHRLLRWRQRIIRPSVAQFDYRLHCLLVDWVVETFLAEKRTLCEFGCGPAYHLLRARRFNPRARLVGLDWTTASQEIIREISAAGLDSNLEGRRFDFYNPDRSFDPGPDAGVLTVAALEQVGPRFEPFLQFLIEKRPAVCVHLEPIDELMDEKNLTDRLSMLYCRKRNYLRGYLSRLRALQTEGRVKILREQRTYAGSFFIEGHSLVVWTPL
jgi:hypothetical protein